MKEKKSRALIFFVFISKPELSPDRSNAAAKDSGGKT